MSKRLFEALSLGVILTLVGCSPTLPLGEPPAILEGYSSAVLVGTIVRDPMTGRYSVLADGAPLMVSAFNAEQPPLADTVDEEQLAQLIGAQAQLIARERELHEAQLAQVIKDLTTAPDVRGLHEQYVFVGQKFGRPR